MLEHETPFENDENYPPKDPAERALEILETGKYSDCSFIVGTEPNQQIFKAHKPLLMVASPVFEAMFYGSMAEKNTVSIHDIAPENFKLLLQYIYTKAISFTSNDQAYEICYIAKKYMIPPLAKECLNYMETNLSPEIAWRTYEVAKLFEEPTLMEHCLDVMCKNTKVILGSNFDNAQLDTVVTLFEQKELDIDSELDLFKALENYVLNNNIDYGESTDSNQDNKDTVRKALMNIRFLTLTPCEFTSSPAKSNWMTESEKFAILMNCSQHLSCPMPDGFSLSTTIRKKVQQSLPKSRKKCALPLDEHFEIDNLRQSDLYFKCDKDIYIYGIEVSSDLTKPSNSYYEELYVYLTDDYCNKIFPSAEIRSMVSRHSNYILDVQFSHRIRISKEKRYRINIKIKSQGRYAAAECTTTTMLNGVLFDFEQDFPGKQIVHSIDFEELVQ